MVNNGSGLSIRLKKGKISTPLTLSLCRARIPTRRLFTHSTLEPRTGTDTGHHPDQEPFSVPHTRRWGSTDLHTQEMWWCGTLNLLLSQSRKTTPIVLSFNFYSPVELLVSLSSSPRPVFPTLGSSRLPKNRLDYLPETVTTSTLSPESVQGTTTERRVLGLRSLSSTSPETTPDRG